MGDSEAVATRTSGATALYGSAGYAAGAQEAGGVVGEVSREGDNVRMDSNSMTQGFYVNETHEAKAAGESAVVGQDTVILENSAPGYNSFTNGSVVNQVVNAPSAENGIASHDVVGAAAAQVVEGVSALHWRNRCEHTLSEALASPVFLLTSQVQPISAEEDRLWSTVRANSLDFDAWVALIEETERTAEGNILKIRRVYDAFLAEFPLCYGYWKKYADHEAQNSTDKAVEVYERAVQAVTYSVDIWLHYCRFAKSKYEDPDVIRRLFERGLAYVGTDYLSFTLWDEYIEYEYKQQEWGRIAVIYTKILENPILYLDKYYNGFKELAANRPLSELKTVEEGAATATLVPDNSGQADEREVSSDAVDQSPKPVSAGLTEAEELEKYIAIREDMYKKAKEFDSKIVGFETAIARPYFHVKPLNIAELENWHNYLNFMESEDDFSKVVKLYERCLIACANYPEYWIRYIKCMEARGSMDLAENALVRATQVFVKRQPEIHLFAAWFKEHNGDVLGARAAYQLVHTELAPGLLEAIIKHANMERRLGNLDDALSVYEQAIAIEKGKEQSQTLPVLFAQYARFLHLVPGKGEKAREILVEAPESVQCSKPFLETLICIETMSPLPKRIEYLDALVERFIASSSDSNSNASVIEREELSSIFLEFLDLVGDASFVKKAHDRHLKLFLHKRSSSLSKKRHAEEFLSSDKSKLAKSDPTVPVSAQSLMGSYPGSQNQWTASYGVQPQTWPQAAQAPLQQWNPGYAQSAATAYSGYGAGYPPQQVPTSVPQTGAYGTYSSTYPVQTAPQQTYAQAAAATVAPSQQASVPQAYYGSYY